ncbi:hypothetical protein niasHS_011174 [Heterodera schachtii]|uniref:WAP domain-containing protein n=1 Tax=Heterodera schachtii TaxID=97005 RepID=A0ABD2IYT6_HETSC
MLLRDGYHHNASSSSSYFCSNFPLKFCCCWSFVLLHLLHSVQFFAPSKGLGPPTVSPLKSIGRTTIVPRAPPLLGHQRRVLTLPRIAVKPDATMVVTAVPYRPRQPPMEWCDYLKEVGVETAKCDGGEGNKRSKGGGRRRKKKRGKKERIVVELLGRTMEQQQEEEEEEKGERKEGRGQRQLLMAMAEELRRKLKQQQQQEEVEEDKQYIFEGVGNFPSCQGYFVRCRPSSAGVCASGTLCHSRASDAHCCRRHADAQCPSADELGYNCRQANPVNWCAEIFLGNANAFVCPPFRCNVNADCAANALRSRICCPTGCGYNVCVSNVQQPMLRRIGQMEARTRLMSPDCPSPFQIRIKCVVPRPASWCHSARECPTYSKAYPRRCCLTPCGYNVCMTKFGDGGWIIA